MKFMRNGMNMVDLAAIIPFILTVILETMDDIVIIGETACTDKKEKKVFLIYKEIQMRSGCKVIFSMTNGLLVYG